MAKRRSAFDRCVEDVEARGTAYDPRAVCATIGRRKYGQREMTRRAIAGKRRVARGNVRRKSGIPEFVSPGTVMFLNDSWSLNVEVEILEWNYGHAEKIGYEHTYDKALVRKLRTGKELVVHHFQLSFAARHNPYESAAELSEAFHGRPAESVEYVETPIHVHGVLPKLGRLVEIRLKDGTKFEFDANTRLSSNEAGTQLFVDGGDQSVDLSEFPEVDPTKEAVKLGPVKKIVYWTAKFHLDKRDETPGPYVHTLGEESGDLPDLHYDTVNRLLSFVGGRYHIDFDMEGGQYSAGIRD